MTKIIGHRGAKGLALENSLESLRVARALQLYAIEFDVRRTLDGHLIAMHDGLTGRVAEENHIVSRKTLAELHAIKLKNGEFIPTLDEALAVLGDAPTIIEIKDRGSAEELARALSRYPKAQSSFASFKRHELRELKKILPDAKLYLLWPILPVHNARKLGAHAVGLSKWLINPLTYRLALRHNVEVYIYTVNSRFLGRVLRKLYPRAALCTNFPDRFRSLQDRAEQPQIQH